MRDSNYRVESRDGIIWVREADDSEPGKWNVYSITCEMVVATATRELSPTGYWLKVGPDTLCGKPATHLAVVGASDPSGCSYDARPVCPECMEEDERAGELHGYGAQYDYEPLTVEMVEKW